MEFNTQVCTTREQSERLLALGLKEETADCHWCFHRVTATWYIVAHNYDGIGGYCPAWSLHRLVAILEKPTAVFSEFLEISGIYRVTSSGNIYDAMIDEIEDMIENGLFNKEYLEETK